MMPYRKEAIKLYIQLGIPKRKIVLLKILFSTKGRLLLPFVFAIFFLLKRSTIGQYFFLNRRRWVKKTYESNELAPFYPSTGDIPSSKLQGSLEDVVRYAEGQLKSGQGESVSTIRYWLQQKEIPPIIVVDPPLSRTPYAKAKGYIVDGNHRAIAMALKGEPIRSYTGILIKNNSKIALSHKSKYANKYQRFSIAKTYNSGLTSSRDRLITSLEIEFISAVMRETEIPDGMSNLDVATGTGRIISQLEEYSRNSIGVDTSKTMISFAKSRTAISSFVNGDSENLPFKSNQFNIVTCFRLFINLSEDDRKKFLNECRRVMRKSGLLVVDNHCNRISLTGLLGNLRKRFTTNPDDPYKLYHLLTESEFNHELCSAGFIRCKKMYSFLPAISHLSMISASNQHRIDRYLVKIPILRPFADLIVVALEK
jgi:ubiquinone/menaquinone biosynthesis C-methylase UbiE